MNMTRPMTAPMAGAMDAGNNPLTFLSPIAHFDAMQFATLGLSSTLVDSWASLDGAYSFTSAGGDRPTYQATGMDGKPALDFTGSDVMNCNPLAPMFSGDDVPMAAFMVCEIDVLQNNDLLVWGSSTDADPLAIMRQTATQYAFIKRQDTGGSAIGPIGGTSGTAVHTYSFRTTADGQSATIRVNGSDIATATIDVGQTTTDVLALGARDSNGVVSQHTNGRIGEVIIFDRHVTDQAAAYIDSYLARKWNV